MLLKKDPMRYVLGKIKMSLLLWYPTPYYLKFFIIISLISTWKFNCYSSHNRNYYIITGFKSNQAYDHGEARIVWGSIVNESRTLVRQMITFIKILSSQLKLVILKKVCQANSMVLQFRSVLNEDAIKPIKSYCLKRNYAL
jgi:putative membrane protein